MERTTDKAVLERIEKNPRYSRLIKVFDMGIAICQGQLQEFKDCKAVWEIDEKVYW